MLVIVTDSFLMCLHPEHAASAHLISRDLEPMSISQTRMFISMLHCSRAQVSNLYSLSFITLSESLLKFTFALKTSSYKNRALFI